MGRRYRFEAHCERVQGSSLQIHVAGSSSNNLQYVDMILENLTLYFHLPEHMSSWRSQSYAMRKVYRKLLLPSHRPRMYKAYVSLGVHSRVGIIMEIALPCFMVFMLAKD